MFLQVCNCLRFSSIMAAPPQGICERLRRFLGGSFSRHDEREEDTRVPVTVRGRPVQVPIVSLAETGPKKASHPPTSKLSKTVSDINQKAKDFIEKRRRLVLGRSMTTPNNPKDESSA